MIAKTGGRLTDLEVMKKPSGRVVETTPVLGSCEWEQHVTQAEEDGRDSSGAEA